MRVSGFPKVQETFARVIGYVEQSDIHSAHVRTQASPCCSHPYELCRSSLTLEEQCANYTHSVASVVGPSKVSTSYMKHGVQITVLESLVYSARLRFSKTVSTDIVYSFVQEVRVVRLLEHCLRICADMLHLCAHTASTSPAVLASLAQRKLRQEQRSTCDI